MEQTEKTEKTPKNKSQEKDKQGPKLTDVGSLAMAVSVLTPVVILIGALFSSRRND